MSNYGAIDNPSIAAAQSLAFTQGFNPIDNGNVMEWEYEGEKVVRKLASRQGKTNALFRIGGPPLPAPDPPDLDPVPAGNPCGICWGNGNPFGVGETPTEITVVVEGVEKGPSWAPAFGEPPNGIFELTQTVLNACGYGFIDANYQFIFLFGPAVGAIAILQLPVGSPSFIAIEDNCTTFFENTVTGTFIGGTVTVFIPPIA